MADSVLRQLAILNTIPREPNFISTTDIFNKIEQDYRITKRQLQRDLDSLSTLLPIQVKTNGRTNYWFFLRDSVLLDIPSMSNETALTFLMVKKYLDKLLPPEVTQTLQPYFNYADKKLTHNQDNFNDWRDKVAFLPRGQQLKPAKADAAILEIVYQSLFENKALLVDYKDKKEQLIHPLGLVYRGSIIYLIATYWGYGDIKQLVLHRIDKAQISDKQFMASENFKLNDYIVEGNMGYQIDTNNIDLVAKFYSDSGRHLEETPLSENQTIAVYDDYLLVSATLPDNEELIWWLQGFGSNVEVVEPIELRDHFLAVIKQSLKRYSTK